MILWLVIGVIAYFAVGFGSFLLINKISKGYNSVGALIGMLTFAPVAVWFLIAEIVGCSRFWNRKVL